MSFILSDDLENTNNWQSLLPLTFTRPIAALRIGIDKIYEKWEAFLNQKISFSTQEYLQAKFPLITEASNIAILGNIIPNKKLAQNILQLPINTVLKDIDGNILAVAFLGNETPTDFSNFNTRIFEKEIIQIKNVWDVFLKNKVVLDADFDRISKGRKSQKLSETNTLIGDTKNIFIEAGAYIEAAILNVQEGKIYIGKNANILEGAVLRNSIAIGENAVVKMGAKIYGATTIGEYSKVGGEISNVVIQGFSNKGHDGYLGNAVLGEWCNLGADTNASNLKNNYQTVKVWDYVTETYQATNQQFCGLIMGDHSKCGINTMFNTATVVGVSANIYGAGYPKTFLPSFTWGGVDANYEYKFSKAMETAELVMQRRKIKLNDTDKKILQHIFDTTRKFRKK